MTIAPRFEIVATTGRTIGIPYSLPKVLVMLFQDQNTVDVAREVNETIRGVYQEPDDLIVASVVNLSAVPRFMRGMAEKMLQKAYQNAAKQLPDDVDPADYIVLLPDWGGDLFRAFSVGDVSRKALMVIIDDQGEIVAQQQGGNLGKLALRELDKLI
jgi:hypothetical protein